jgi:hypothetical protein
VQAGDGRFFLNTTAGHYDAIVVDVYRWPYIPFHLVTREAFEAARSRLSPRGVVVVKCDRGELGQDIAATMRQVFPQVFTLNSLLIGVNAPVGDGVENLRQNLARVRSPTLRRIMQAALDSTAGPAPFQEWKGAGEVFTDDHAPVEYILHRRFWSWFQRMSAQKG